MPQSATDNQPPTTSRRGFLVLLTAIVVLTMPDRTRAQDNEAKFLNELRSRRMFALAEKYCRDELTVAKQADRKTSLIMELSRTLVEHGKFLPNAERESMWESADKVLFDGSGRIPEAELKVRLQAQGAINQAHQATYLRWQSQVTPQDSYLKELTLMRIDKALKSLTSAANRAREPGGSSPFNRSRLRNTLDYHQAQTILDKMRLEKPNSAERIDLATQALKIVKRLSSTAVEDSTRVDARILYAECSRERGDSRRAISILESAMELAANDDDRDRIMAERIRAFLYSQRSDEATKQLIQWRQQRGSLSGELHVLRMQSLIAMWEIARAARNEPLADKLIGQMETGANYARQEVSGYWSLRCDRLLNTTRELAALGSQLAKLKQQAERDYTAGNLTSAATNFGLAAQEALRKEKGELAASLYFQRGSLLVQTENFADAATAFQHSSVADDVQKGSNAHLMQAWCMGRLYLQDKTQERREAYTTLLNEHRSVYKAKPSFSEATFMLGSLEETRLQNTKAIELYKQVQPQDARYKSSSAAIARCYSNVLTRLHELNKPELLDEWLTRAAGDVVPRLQELPPATVPLDLEHAEVAILGASIMLQQTAPQYKPASSYLRRGTEALAKQKPSPKVEQLRAVAQRWRLVAAIAGGQAKDAAPWLDDLRNSSAEELLGVIESLDGLTGGNRQSRLNMAAIRLSVGELAIHRRDELTPPKQLKLAAWMVGTYFDNGKRPEALQQAKQVIDTTRDPQTLSRISSLVQTHRAEQGQLLARKGWKKLQSTAKAGSTTWLNARLHVAECTLQLGDVAECRKLLRVTKLLYPELGGPQLKSAFTTLESRLPLTP